jgi:hypothetical protein
MSSKYVRPTVAGWLTPTLIAPWLSTYGVVTAAAALGIDHGPWGKALGWLLGMVVGSVWAFVFCLFLVLVDLALLGIKVRTLPAGKRGWLTSLVSPLMVFGVYTVAPPYAFWKSGPWTVAAVALVPMVVVAILTRVFGGSKPPR